MPITAKGADDSDDDDEKGICPECNTEVYLIADCCPKCGHWFLDSERAELRRGSSVQTELRFIKKAGALLGVLLVVVLIITAVVSAIRP